jgi:glutamate-1-semialdehyde 2,1-aminomutase
MREGTYRKLEEIGREVEGVLREGAEAAGWGGRVTLNRAGSMFTLFFHPGPVNEYADVAASDREAYGRFFRLMLSAGVYFPPSPFEAAFVNLAMDAAALKRLKKAAKKAFAALADPTP